MKDRHFFLIGPILGILSLILPVFCLAGGFDDFRGYLVKYKGNDSLVLTDTLEGIIGSENVEYYEPNYLYRASMVPNDIFYNRQWYLNKISAQTAWDLTTGNSEVIIAVIDSGVQIEHPDLRKNIWTNLSEIPANGSDDDANGYVDDLNGWDFIDNVADPRPKFKDGFVSDAIIHGTLIAGAAGAVGNNGEGIAGVSWGVRIMPLRILDEAGNGDTRSAVRAIDYAIKNGADIINLSFVGTGHSQSMEAAIERAYKAGIIIIAAAGNETEDEPDYFLDKTPLYPVCYDGNNGENMVLGVAATDALDQKASFSAYGSKCVDISAPGISIFGTSVYDPTKRDKDFVFERYYDGYWAGTSMAVPLVSGAAALVIAANPYMTRDEVVGVILNNTDNINSLNPRYDGLLGKGRLNVFNAVSVAKYKRDHVSAEILVSTNGLFRSEIKTFDSAGGAESRFYPYGNFTGGVNIASGDVNGDGKDEIIVGADKGGGPHLKIYDKEGKLLKQFFAFSASYAGGIAAAAADFNGDSRDEIVVAAKSGGNSEVKIFDFNGNLLKKFNAFEKAFKNKFYIAAGDVDGDGEAEIIVGAGEGSTPVIKIFKYDGRLQGQFYAYDKGMKSGVHVALISLSPKVRDSKKMIAVAPGVGGGPHVKIFDNKGVLHRQFFAFDKKFRGGVSIAAGDINLDGKDEIITGAGPGGAPHVRVFRDNGELLSSFYSFKKEYEGGVNVGIVSK